MIEQVIVFTRAPVDGQVKTRLIPALGPEGAAELHRQMTLHTLAMLDRLAETRDVVVEVRFTGGDEAAMHTFLGEGRIVRDQGTGDLGDRLARAIQEAFEKGERRVIAIGTDCPALGPEHLAAAFEALRGKDLVLGPSSDGGYYLVGLRRPCASLFSGIEWGSAHVYAQTLQRAEDGRISVHAMPILADVDTPAELSTWEAHRQIYLHHGRRPRLSVIVPTLDEEECLPQTIASIPDRDRVEVIVADGGSRDGTVALARSLRVPVVDAPRGRASQMNAGALAAKGDVLAFLHADTRLPAGADREIERVFARREVALMAFQLHIDHPSAAIRCIEHLANLRTRWLRIPFGDQALAVRASVFRKLGGYRLLESMEDLDLVRRAHRFGKLVISNLRVDTSARRWLEGGVLRTTLVHQACLLGYWAGVSPKRLARWRGDP